MSRICYVCSKRPRVANWVSHANNKTKRILYPNVHKMRFIVNGDPARKVVSAKVCTKCFKANKIQKIV